MIKLIRDFISDTSGATSIEYAIIAGGLSIVVLGAVNAIGGTLKSGYYEAVSSSLK